MELTDGQIKEYTRKLLLARMRTLSDRGFFGILLMHAKLGLTTDVECACCNARGEIFFNPEFLKRLSDEELDFILMHEIMHVALRHLARHDGERDWNRFNVACDIVINSILFQSIGKEIAVDGETPMHLSPDGREGREFTAEELYGLLAAMKKPPRKKDSGSFDVHVISGDSDEDFEDDVWEQRVISAAEAISIRDPSNSRGLLPAFARRLLTDLKKPQTDWRTILTEFVQEDIVDYSFTPPDRRFDDNPFFLPDFNETAETVRDILFMVDTSGSMSDDMVTAAFSEIKGAIDQFNGALKGWLGFFDAAVIEPEPFETEEEFKVIRPKGGGGTSFHAVFKYVKEKMRDEPPASIIILTDGRAPFPKEEAAMGIPVLWLLNNEEITPPWGKTARIRVGEKK